MKDVINNRSRDFITRNTKSIKWSKGTTEFVLRGKSIGGVDEALKLIYSQMRHRAVSLGYPRVPINFDAKGSYTDLKSIWVGLDYIHDKDFTLEQKVDIAKGLASHELAHIMYTCQSAKNRWEKNLSREDANITNTQVFLDIANILEDERIETNLIKKFGGVADDLALVKRRYFSKVVDFNPQGEVQNALVLLLYIVRYPSSIPQELIDAQQDFYEFVCERIDTLYNKTRLTAKKDYEHILQASLDIIKVLPMGDGKSIEQVEKDAQKQLEDAQNQINNASNEKEKIRDEAYEALSETEDAEERDKIKANATQLLEEQDKIIEEAREKRNEAKDLQWNPFGKGNSLNETLDAKSDDDARNFEELSKNHNLDEITERGSFVKCEGHICKPIVDEGYSRYLPSDKFEEHHNAIKPLMGTLKQAMALQFETRNRIVRNQRSGRIKNVVGAHIGRQDVFARKPRMTQDKLNLVILIDQSGSMGDQKIEIARDFAMLFYQTFRNSPNVDLWMYGLRSLGSDHRTEEFYSPKMKGEFRKRFLGMVDGGANDDGHQIVSLVDHVRSHTQEPCVLVCISDGEPHDYDYLKYSVRYAKSQNFFPIQIGIGTEYEKRGNKFFDEWAEASFDDIYTNGLPLAVLRKQVVKKFSQVVRTKVASVLA